MDRLFELQMVLMHGVAGIRKRETPHALHMQPRCLAPHTMKRLYFACDVRFARWAGSLLSALFKNCCHKIYSKCAAGATEYQFPRCDLHLRRRASLGECHNRGAFASVKSAKQFNWCKSGKSHCSFIPQFGLLTGFQLVFIQLSHYMDTIYFQFWTLIIFKSHF